MKIAIGMASYNRLHILDDYLREIELLSLALNHNIQIKTFVYLQEKDSKRSKTIKNKHKNTVFYITTPYQSGTRIGRIIQDGMLFLREASELYNPDIYIWSDDDITIKDYKGAASNLIDIFYHFISDNSIGTAAISENLHEDNYLGFGLLDNNLEIHPKNQTWNLFKKELFENKNFLNDSLLSQFSIGEDAYLNLKSYAFKLKHGVYIGMTKYMLPMKLDENERGGIYNLIPYVVRKNVPYSHRSLYLDAFMPKQVYPEIFKFPTAIYPHYVSQEGIQILNRSKLDENNKINIKGVLTC